VNEPQVWKDDKTGYMVVLTRTQGAGSADNVRTQTGGFVEGLINSGNILPKSVKAVSVGQLPALELRGDLLTGPPGFKFVSIIAFAQEQTFVIHGFGPAEPPLSLLETRGRPGGAPFGEARAVISDLVSRMNKELTQLAQLARKVHETQAAENRLR
jgi:hypothetical protein